MCIPSTYTMGFLEEGEKDTNSTENTDTKIKLRNITMDLGEEEEHELEDDYDEDEDLEDEDDDDSCSDQSSTTSTSTSNNQRVDGGRVCDCCYCEVFGHGVPAVAPTSRNYNEMRERLRSRLNKRKAERGRCENPANLNANGSDNRAELVEKEDNRDLEELLNFIEGTSSRDSGNSGKGKKKKDRRKKKRERQKDRKNSSSPGLSVSANKTANAVDEDEDTPLNSTLTSTNTSSNTNETLISISANTETKNRQNQKHVYSNHRNCDHGYSSSHKTLTTSKVKATSSRMATVGRLFANALRASNVNNNRKNQLGINNNNEKTSLSDNNCLKPSNHSSEQVNGEYSPKEGRKCDNKKLGKDRDKKNNEDIVSPDEVFLPKSDIDIENGELDEIEKEVEAFKRFCFNSVPRARKDKVNVNLKDILIKKRPLTNNFESERITLTK